MADVSSSGQPTGRSDVSSSAARTRQRRLRWIGHLAAGLSLFALLRAVSSPWFTFAFTGNVQPSWQTPPTEVSVDKVFYASDVVALFGGVGSLPMPLVLIVTMLVATAVAAWLQLWVLSVGATVVLMPMAWLQLDAMSLQLQSGPSGDLVTMGSGPQTAVFAMFAAASCALAVTVQVFALRRAQVAQARAQAAAEGTPLPPTLRELAGGLVASRLGRFANPHPSTVKSPSS